MTLLPPNDARKILGAIKDLQGFFEGIHQDSLEQSRKHSDQLSAIEARLKHLEKLETATNTPTQSEAPSPLLINDLCAELETTKADLKKSQAQVLALQKQLGSLRSIPSENASQQQTKIINGIIIPQGHDTSMNDLGQLTERQASPHYAQRAPHTKAASAPTPARPLPTSPAATAPPPMRPIPAQWRHIISAWYHKGDEETLLKLNPIQITVDEDTQRQRRGKPALPVILTPNQSTQYHYLVLPGGPDTWMAVPKMGLVINSKIAHMIALKDLYEISGKSGLIRSIEAPALLSKQGDHFRILQKGHLTLGS